MTDLQPGQTAPLFSLESDSAGRFDLSAQQGKKVVLFFYPRDDTPGCTIEANDFTALRPEFDKRNAVLVGISCDSLKDHASFRKKHDLDVILVSDPNREAVEAYGTWAAKKLFGKSLFGIERATFLIDENGNIDRIWRKVKVAGHAQEVLNHISETGQE